VARKNSCGTIHLKDQKKHLWSKEHRSETKAYEVAVLIGSKLFRESKKLIKASYDPLDRRYM
jgi:hypothetical protein